MNVATKVLTLLATCLLFGCAQLSQGEGAAPDRAPVASGYQQLDKGASQAYVYCQPCVQHTPKTLSAAPLVERARAEQKTADTASLARAPSHAASAPEEAIVSLAVHFDSDSAKLDQAAQETLKAYCQAATTLDGVTVTGHTDATGSSARNQVLAQQRASSTSQFLRVCAEQLGKPVHVIEQAHAACCYAATNDTPQGRAMNRRADIETRPLLQAGQR